jgi:RimJ/RimL family protein N-acetyltransferase
MTALWPRFERSLALVAEWHRSLPDLVCTGFRMREPCLLDAGRLSAAFGPEAASRLGIAAPGTSDDWMHFVARVRTGRAARQTVCYVVTPERSTDVAGLTLLQRPASGSRAATLSSVFSEAHWDTELPALSSACMLGFAFLGVGLARVEGRAGASREFDAVRRLGAVVEGVLRQSRPVGGGFADQVLWSVLATEWTESDQVESSVWVRVDQERPVPRDPAGGGDVEQPAWTLRLPTLEGSVVTLREIDLPDVPALLEALETSDIEVAFEPVPSTPDELRRYISWVRLQRTKGRAAGFAIVPRGAGQAAGLLQVGRVDFAGAVAEWGIVLARSHRGTGAASEAARLMAEFAFETLGVHRLETRASGISPGSIALLRKLGAVCEAHLRQSFAHGSEVVDDDLWAIIESDWRGPRTFSGARSGCVPLPASPRQ